MKDQVQENMNIRNDLTQVILAKEEDEMKVLQEETGMLLDEIEEIKRVIEDYGKKKTCYSYDMILQ
jgi:hypothetical protein